MSVGGVTLAILTSVLALAGATIGNAPEITGSIGVPSAGDYIPIDIGEASSIELPITPAEDIPPVTRAPQSLPPNERHVDR